MKVEAFRTTLHSILPLPMESSLKTICIPKKKMEEILYPITMKLFYEQECRLQILPQQYSVLSLLFLRCSAPPFCFLRMSRPFTLLHSHPPAVPQFFTFLSPFPDSLFSCPRNRIPLSVFMLSCCRKVSKQYV